MCLFKSFLMQGNEVITARLLITFDLLFRLSLQKCHLLGATSISNHLATESRIK